MLKEEDIVIIDETIKVMRVVVRNMPSQESIGAANSIAELLKVKYTIKDIK